MKFICLGYMDETKWDALSEDERAMLMEECFAYDDELRRGGHFIGGEALQSARNTATLSFQDGKVLVTDGPFAETKEQIGGILAIQLMSKHPGVRNGPFEIRPAHEEINVLVKARDASFHAS